jgi:hypothetical protein
VEYFGSSDPLQKANDYEECYKEIFSSDEDDEDGDKLAGETILEDKNKENIAVVENLDDI